MKYDLAKKAAKAKARFPIYAGLTITAFLALALRVSSADALTIDQIVMIIVFSLLVVKTCSVWWIRSFDC